MTVCVFVFVGVIVGDEVRMFCLSCATDASMDCRQCVVNNKNESNRRQARRGGLNGLSMRGSNCARGPHGIYRRADTLIRFSLDP